MSAMISKVGSYATRGYQDPTSIERTLIIATFSGMASKASGGDFAQGAIQAAMVHLYNDLSSFSIGYPDTFLDQIFRSFGGVVEHEVQKVSEPIVARSSGEVGIEDCKMGCLGLTIEQSATGNTYIEAAATGLYGKFNAGFAYKFNILNFGENVPLYGKYNFLDVDAIYGIGFEYSHKHWIDNQGALQENVEVNFMLSPSVGGGAAVGKGVRAH